MSQAELSRKCAYVLLVVSCTGGPATSDAVHNSTTSPAIQTESVQSFSLSPGPFVVGFRTAELTDASRIDDADPVLGMRPREITAFIWYPATANTGSQPMVYGDYVYLDALKMGRRRITENWRVVVEGMLLLRYQPSGLTRERLDRELASTTWAYRNAPEAPGPFPLVLYGPGGANAAWDNSVLAEYLASHGYVVAAVPTRGWYSVLSSYPTGYVGSAAVAADLELVLAELRTWTNVSDTSVAAMGYSRGGLTNVMMQMRDPSIRALVGLDGTIAYRYRNDPNAWSDPATTPGSLAVTGFGQSDRVDVPFLWIGNQYPGADEVRKGWGGDIGFPFWDQLKYSMAYRVGFTELQHQDFSSSSIRFQPEAAEIGPVREQELKNRRYETIALYVRQFLDAHLKADVEALAFLERDPEANGLPPGAATIQRLRPIGPAPTMTALRRIAEDHGFAALDSILPSLRAVDPAWSLPEPDLVNWGWTLLAEGRCDDALGVMRFAARLHPESATVRNVEGDTELALGDSNAAAASYRSALAADANNSYAVARLAELEGGELPRRLVRCGSMTPDLGPDDSAAG
jgi:dienelactone hydrolase